MLVELYPLSTPRRLISLSAAPPTPGPLLLMRCEMQLFSFKRPTCHSIAQNEQGPVGVLEYISESVRPGAHLCVSGECKVTSILKIVSA